VQAGTITVQYIVRNGCDEPASGKKTAGPCFVDNEVATFE
jgi:hypothetical protein